MLNQNRMLVAFALASISAGLWAEDLSEWNDPTAGMFQHPSDGPDTIASNETGMTKIQVDALLRHHEVANALALIDSQAVSGLSVLLKPKKPPVFHLRDIKSIACGTSLEIGFRPNANLNGIVVPEAGVCTVELNKNIDLSWLQENSESVRQLNRGAQTIYEITNANFFRDSPMLIASRDANTLCLCNFMPGNPANVQDADDLAEALRFTKTRNTSEWGKAFRQVDGGIIVVAIPNRTIDLRAFNRLGAGPDRAIKRIATHFRTVAIGLDWSDAQVGVRIRLATSDSNAAKLILNDARMLHQHAKRKCAALKPTEGIVNARFTNGLLESMVMRHENHDDGSASVDIRASAPFSLADVMAPVLVP